MNNKEKQKLDEAYLKTIIDYFNRIDTNEETDRYFFFEHMQYYIRKYLLEIEQKGGFNSAYNNKKLKTEAINFLRKEENKNNLQKVMFTINLINKQYTIVAKIGHSIKDYYLQIKRGNLRPLLRESTLTSLQIYKDNELIYELGDHTGFPVRQDLKVNNKSLG